ncbi:MAG: hypothetical protein RR283_06890, partial [Comamonas sp.]
VCASQVDRAGTKVSRHSTVKWVSKNSGISRVSAVMDRDGRHWRADAVTMAARARMPGRTGTHTGKVPARS